jgi:uncharacterized protein YndB with AHSA1/START domain
MTLSPPSLGVLPDPPGKYLPADGTVRVWADLPSSIDVAWAAVTDREAFGRWFGDLDRPLREGGSARIAFGDGDCFDVEQIRLDPPGHLSYTWRFQGIGPVNWIDWRLAPREDGCRLIVCDDEPERSTDGVLRMREGWLDFLGRLQRYLSTGHEARYDWSRDIEASVEVAADAETLRARWLDSEGRRHWLVPLLAPETAMSDVDLTPRRLTFSLRAPGWRAATSCAVELQPRRAGTQVAIRHGGWDGIGPDGLNQRRTYCQRWIAALTHLRVLVGQDASRAS